MSRTPPIRPRPKSVVDDCEAISARIREIAKEENRQPTIDALSPHQPTNTLTMCAPLRSGGVQLLATMDALAAYITDSGYGALISDLD